MFRRTVLLAVVLAFGGPASAEEAQRTEASVADRCAPFVASATEIKSRMYAFEPTFGKDPMMWSDADYDSIARAASACDGIVEKGVLISGGFWKKMMRDVKKRVYPVAVVNRTASAYAAGVGGRIRVPDCRSMPDYRIDDGTSIDNSETMFGVDLFSMTDDEIDAVVGYANICRAVIPEWLGVSGKMRIAVGLAPVERMMDRFLLLKARRGEWAATSSDGLILALPNGAKVPPTMTSTKVRELVTAFDQWANSGYYQAPNTMSRLLGILDRAEKHADGPFDRLYVEKIRTFVQDRMLNR